MRHIEKYKSGTVFEPFIERVIADHVARKTGVTGKAVSVFFFIRQPRALFMTEAEAAEILPFVPLT